MPVKKPENEILQLTKHIYTVWCITWRERGLQCLIVVSCIHFHKPTARPASADDHFLPLTTYSSQSAFYSLTANEKIPSSAFHDIYKRKLAIGNISLGKIRKYCCRLNAATTFPFGKAGHVEWTIIPLQLIARLYDSHSICSLQSRNLLFSHHT